MSGKTLIMPFPDKVLHALKAGDEVLLTGTIYTARDQAHALLCEALNSGRKLPVDLKGRLIYFCGPAKTPPGKIIGSCGPTTSRRMDRFSPVLLKHGLLGMIGKGSRDRSVVDAIRKNKGIYFLTYAGCGALLSRCVRKSSCVAYPQLGPEAIYRLEVENMPLIVGIDSEGRDIYSRLGI